MPAVRPSDGIIPAYAGSTRIPPSCSGWRPDHPRIRGEHPATTRGPILSRGIIPAYAGSTGANGFDGDGLRGSSPHTRGAPGFVVKLTVAGRIIPAYAGSTSPSLASTSARRDHPRIRGEHGDLQPEVVIGGGSSPHTRGAPTTSTCGVGIPGIIPAYAGSTERGRRHHFPQQDHPRIRGEHDTPLTNVTPFTGSSPHTRGAHGSKRREAEKCRIIPAYAGSTRPGPWCPTTRTDHPRIRGEHVTSCFVSIALVGSSPHTRGAPPRTGRGPCGPRIIPAYAGSTVPPPPSVCCPAGSSPHTRGARAVVECAGSAPGIIPAYAGSTSFLFFVTRGCRDHPRIRGEHVGLLRQVASETGSSPHTRGARSSIAYWILRSGIIPAYAGSTVSTSCWITSVEDHPRIRGEHSTRWSSPS